MTVVVICPELNLLLYTHEDHPHYNSVVTVTDDLLWSRSAV